MRAWYLPTCVNGAMPVTSPIAQTFSAARICSSTSMPRRRRSQPERLEPGEVRAPARGDEQAVVRDLAAVVEDDRPAVDAQRMRAEPDVDAVRAQRLVDLGCGVGVDPREDAVAALDQGDGGADAAGRTARARSPRGRRRARRGGAGASDASVASMFVQ